jgi:hypothetical protein
MLDGVKAFFIKYAVFILLGVIVGLVAYGGVVIYGLKSTVEAHQNTIKQQTTEIAKLTADKAVLEQANIEFKKAADRQNEKIAGWEAAADAAQKTSAAELARVRAENAKLREAYSFIWSTKKEYTPDQECEVFFDILNRYIDTRQKEIAK